MSWNGKVIMVTGANRGIGRAILESLATHSVTKDATLLLGCRDPGKGQLVIEEITGSTTSRIEAIQIDVTSDNSICAAVAEIGSRFGRLDILVNNAGFAMLPKAADFSDVREAWSTTLNTNVSSVAVTTLLFLPLLRKAEAGAKVINVSSARGSISRSANGQLPPTTSASYSVSKTALNALTVEMSRQEDNKNVEFQLACPGHCKTQFNGFRGARDPAEGANVVVELIVGKRRKTGYWETHGASRELIEVPW